MARPTQSRAHNSRHKSKFKMKLLRLLDGPHPCPPSCPLPQCPLCYYLVIHIPLPPTSSSPLPCILNSMASPLLDQPHRLHSRDRSHNLVRWFNASLTLLAFAGFGLASWFFATTHPGASSSSALPPLPVPAPLVTSSIPSPFPLASGTLYIYSDLPSALFYRQLPALPIAAPGSVPSLSAAGAPPIVQPIVRPAPKPVPVAVSGGSKPKP